MVRICAQRSPLNWFSFVQKTKKKLLIVGAIFTVLAITLLFQVRFRPVNYRLKGLIVLFMTTRKQSVDSQWGLVKVLVKLLLNLVKLGQIWVLFSNRWVLPRSNETGRFWMDSRLFSRFLDSLSFCAKTRKILGSKMWCWQRFWQLC